MCDKQLPFKAFFPLVFEFFHILNVDKHFDRVLLRACLFCTTSLGCAAPHGVQLLPAPAI